MNYVIQAFVIYKSKTTGHWFVQFGSQMTRRVSGVYELLLDECENVGEEILFNIVTDAVLEHQHEEIELQKVEEHA